jgi:hypothetical protein
MEVPLPPYPVLEGQVAVVALSAAVAAGAVLLLWGWLVGRFALAAALAGAAVLLAAQPVADWLGLDLIYAQLGVGVLAAAVGVGLARLVWGLLGAAVVAAGAQLLVLAQTWETLVESLPPDTAMPEFAPVESFNAWAVELASWLWDALAVLWGGLTSLAVMLILAPAILVVVVALVRPRLMAIAMSALCGAALVVGAALLTAARFSASVWPGQWLAWLVPLGVVVLVAGVSVALQYRWALRRERRREQRRKEAEESQAAGAQAGAQPPGKKEA